MKSDSFSVENSSKILNYISNKVYLLLHLVFTKQLNNNWHQTQCHKAFATSQPNLNMNGSDKCKNAQNIYCTVDWYSNIKATTFLSTDLYNLSSMSWRHINSINAKQYTNYSFDFIPSLLKSIILHRRRRSYKCKIVFLLFSEFIFQVLNWIQQ